MRRGSPRRPKRAVALLRCSIRRRPRSLSANSNAAARAMSFSASPIIRLISGRWSRKTRRGSSGCSSVRPANRSTRSFKRSLSRRDEHEADLMPALRRAKREAALLVALADIGGVWDVVAATEALTRFADAAVRAALAFLLRKHARAGLLALDVDAADIESGSGLVVLALGKHGARELNYSSDIDLIVLFDPAATSIPQGTEPGPLFVRLTKALARLLQERTGEGYVLRVDLRLRPDPASTPVALATVERLSILRDGRPELGACSADQSPSGGGRPQAWRALPGRPRAIHLAQVFRLCGDRRHPRDEAPDPCRARPRASRRARPRCQTWTRRHPRDRVLRPDAAAYFWRTPPPDARIAHPRHAAAIVRRQVDQRGRGRRPKLGLRVSPPRSNIGCRWSPTSRRSAFHSSERR